MTLKKLNCEMTICKVRSMEDAIVDGNFLFIGKTDVEISLVCETAHAPRETLERNDGWLGFRIEGQLEFSLIGILARLSKVLADAGIGIFVVSTFDTDYILVKAENFRRAIEKLRADGYEIAD